MPTSQLRTLSGTFTGLLPQRACLPLELHSAQALSPGSHTSGRPSPSWEGLWLAVRKECEL